MTGFLCGTTAKNNEEYKGVVKKRMRLMLVLMGVGLLTALVALYAEVYLRPAISERMLGVYTGVGTGLFVAGIALYIKNRMLLSNEEKLKESRLKNSDERILEISGKATRIASFVMLIAMYIICLVGGLFDPMLINLLLVVVAIFLVTNAAAYKYYERKM